MRTHRVGQLFCALVLSAAAWLLGSCAQQGAPQGGPPDTTPPTVDLTVPGSADVLVALDRGLSLQFSEPMERATVETGFSLSPSRGGTPEFEWSNGSRRVNIVWPDSLRDSTTYRVTLSNRVTDRRGNKLAQPYTFAFSTGDHVDRGELRGQVYFSGGKAESFDAFAFRVDMMPDTFWLSPPDYATQTGTDGRFQLPFLRGGQYRLLVLTDANRNQKLDHGEQFALAVRDLTVGDEIPADSVFLFPTVFDTVPFTLKSCIGVGRSFVELTFSHPLDTSRASEWLITAYDSSMGLSVDVFSPRPTAKRINSITVEGRWNEGSVYALNAERIWDQQGRDVNVSPCRLVYSAPVDTTGPRIESASLPTVSAGMTPQDPLIWTFSESVDSAKLSGHVRVSDTVGGDISGRFFWGDPQILKFMPAESWIDTVEIVATIDSVYLADLLGNVAGPGVYKWRFRPLGEGSMGAIEGWTESALSSLPDYWVEVHEVGKSRMTRVRLSGPGQYILSVPAGRWQLGGFVDSDGDGRWSAGSVNPYTTPELRAAPGDTLDVRARFTLEDIVLRF